MRKLIVSTLMVWAIGTGNLSAQGMTPAAPVYVFFDWGKPGLTADAKATLDGIAAEYRRKPNALVEIAGHGDRSGSAVVNRRSALERARSVAAYLEAQGVPRAVLRTVSQGEDRPLIATEDGVREVQNRRVEIRVGAARAAGR